LAFSRLVLLAGRYGVGALMLRALRHSLKRRLESASASPRANAALPVAPSIAAAIHRDRGVTAQRAGYQVLNSAIARRGADMLTAQMGGRYRVISEHEDAGRTDLTGLTAALIRQTVITGDGFAVLSVDPDGVLKIRLIDARQVGDMGADIPAGRLVIGGVEIDEFGDVFAFHVRPGEHDVTAAPPVRIPADDVLHVFRQESPGALRGASWFAAVLQNISDIAGHLDADLLRRRTAASWMGLLRDPDGMAAETVAGASGVNGIAQGVLEPGTIKAIGHYEFQSPAMPDPSDIGPALAFHLRTIAAALGLTYEQLSGDLSGANYSSIRAGLIESRRLIEGWRRELVELSILRPVWRRWCLVGALRGDPLFDGYLTDPEPFHAVNLVPPAWSWVDPLKDVQAEAAAIAAGLKSRREAVAARGRDIATLDLEIAADRDRAAGLGLDFAPATPDLGAPNAA